MEAMNRKIICALDTSDLVDALATVRRLAPHVSAFKIGHALTLPYGLEVIDRLQEAGAQRVFLDLKLHDIPNSVALAVREAAKHNVWMLTLHIAGGPAMMTAAVEEAASRGAEAAPLLVGVSVLTSLDQHVLTDHLGIQRSVEEHMVYLSKLAIDCGMDGVVCSVKEVQAVRGALGHAGVIVTPGIRLLHGDVHDQRRVGTARAAVEQGADYLVVGRALTSAPDIEGALRALDLGDLTTTH
jgi:orotidine-5'-phosphate decarboxylase